MVPEDTPERRLALDEEEAAAVARTKALLLVIGADADIARKAATGASMGDNCSPEADDGGHVCMSDDGGPESEPTRRLDPPPLPMSTSAKAKPLPKSTSAKAKASPKCWPAPPRAFGSSGAMPPPPLNASSHANGGGWGHWGNWRGVSQPNKSMPMPPPGPMAELLMARKRIRGVVKRYSEVTEFGFIVGDEVDKHLGEQMQVFLHRSALQDSEDAAVVLLGAEVSFSVKMNREGRPQAREVKVEVPGLSSSGDEKKIERLCPAVDMAGYSPDKTYTGTVKSFNEEKGFGFIACEELHTLFARDVFLHHSQRSGFSVGESVAFQIDVDPIKGSPKARCLKAGPVLEGAEAQSPPSTATPLSDSVSSDSCEAPVCASPPSEALEKDSEEPQKDAMLAVPTPSRASGCAEEASSPLDEPVLPASTASDQGACAEQDYSKAVADDALSSQSEVPWEQYQSDDGSPWWWSPVDGTCFVEACPDPWAKYSDPDSGRCYWYLDEHHWFWVHTRTTVG